MFGELRIVLVELINSYEWELRTGKIHREGEKEYIEGLFEEDLELYIGVCE